MFLSRAFLYHQVMDIPHALFEEKLEAMKEAKGVKNDNDLTASDLKELVAQYKEVYVEAKGEPFPSGMPTAASPSVDNICMKKKNSLETKAVSLHQTYACLYLVLSCRSQEAA